MRQPLHNKFFLCAVFAAILWLLPAAPLFAGSCFWATACYYPTLPGEILPVTEAQCLTRPGVYYSSNNCTGPYSGSAAPAPTTETGGEPPAEPITPRLQIPIPGLPQLSDVTVFTEDGRRVADIPFLAEYLAGLYRFLVGLAGLAATVMIIVGGMRWLLAAGDAGKIGAAKTTITSATVGLIIALGSYIILFTLNPELVSFRSLRVGITNPETLDVEGAEGSEETEPAALESCATTFSAASAAASTCPITGKLVLPTGKQPKCNYHFKNANFDFQKITSVDIPESFGAAVVAVMGGTVDVLPKDGNCGNKLRIRQTIGGKEYRVAYCHLSRYRDGLETGDRVEKGEVVGYSGGACCNGETPPTDGSGNRLRGWGSLACNVAPNGTPPTNCSKPNEAGNTTGPHLHMQATFPILPCLPASGG